METKVLIYSKEDIKKAGGFKKKFLINWINKEDFFKYLKENNLNIQSQYIDLTGDISNGKRFRCSLDNGFIVGVSGIVKEFLEARQ